MRILADGLAPLQTGLVARLEALVDRFNLQSRTEFNIRDEEYGAAGDGVTDDAGAIDAAYADAVAEGGGTVVIPAGIYKYTTDLDWTSNVVSVIGAGSSFVTLQAAGSAQINIKPSPITVIQGPKFGGFTVKGDPAFPVDAIGIYTGDIIGTQWDDLVIENFEEGDGLWFDNVDLFTERNLFLRVWLNNNKRSLRLSHTGGGGPDGTNSFGYNRFLDLRINVWAGQTAVTAQDDINLYSSTLVMTCNVDCTAPDPATVFDIQDTAQFNGVLFQVGAEQTAGTGGVGRKVASTAHVFGYGVTRFENGLTDDFIGGPRRTPAWRVMSPEAKTAALTTNLDGQLIDTFGSGETANIYPLLWDSPQDPYASIGMLVGPNVRSPYVAMYDDPVNSAFAVYRVPFAAASMADMDECLRITPHGGISTAAVVEPPTVANGAAVGSSPPAAASSGNNTRGTISLGTGASGVAAGVAATVTFLIAYSDVPEVTLTPLTALAAAVQPYIASRSTTGFTIGFGVPPAISQIVGTYAFTFHVLG